MARLVLAIALQTLLYVAGGWVVIKYLIRPLITGRFPDGRPPRGTPDLNHGGAVVDAIL